MKTEYFNYVLPKELIAQTPPEKRGESRLLVLNKTTGKILHKMFHEVIDFLESGDTLVINDTKVIPARIFGKGKKMREILLIKENSKNIWESFVKPQRGLKIGEELLFNNNSISGKILERTSGGTYIIEFSKELPLSEIGYAPLPPYIKRNYSIPEFHEADKIKYQTVYARKPGAIAAPTAGMHFTEELLDKIRYKGIEIAHITLHVGIGTFKPVRSENFEEHEMHSEWFNIPKETTELIKNAKRVIAVGTTTARTLETAIEGSGYTDLFIYPPYKFNIIDRLITNFHTPKSTLLMLVSAFAGRDLIMHAYEEAIKEKYRFFSYGDAMLII